MELTSLSKLLILLRRRESGHETLDDVMIVRAYLWNRLNASAPACWSCSFTPAVPNTVCCFLKGLYADQYLNVQLTDVAVILKARMLYDVYCSGTVDEVEFSVLRLKTG